MRFLFINSLLFVCICSSYSQSTQTSKSTSANTTVYKDIGDYPSEYSAATMMQRVVDGLGYRYYWATEGLTDSDLKYAPGNEGKTVMETVVHLYNLSLTVHNAVKGNDNLRPSPALTMEFSKIRTMTLEMIKSTSDYLRANPKLYMEDLQITFVRGDKKSEFPFWNTINGPLLDAVYHTGQIVAFRRANGNPTNPKVNLFSGKAPE